MAMQEETKLTKFKPNELGTSTKSPGYDHHRILNGYKEIILDENGVVTRNKARLLAQGYNQQEAIDYEETYPPVARLEFIRILLAYACAQDFKLYKMDVKSAFLIGFINEEVSCTTTGFIGLRHNIIINLELEDSKANKTPMSTRKLKLMRDEEGIAHLGLWYPKRSGIETIVYADSDHAGDYVDRKSTSGVCSILDVANILVFDDSKTALQS
ncbi:copia protein [Tanacetum coccineum]